MFYINHIQENGKMLHNASFAFTAQILLAVLRVVKLLIEHLSVFLDMVNIKL